MGYVRSLLPNHHKTSGQSQSQMHVAKISFNPTHTKTIPSTNPCMHATLVKVALAYTCLSPKTTAQANKERTVEIASTTSNTNEEHICTLQTL